MPHIDICNVPHFYKLFPGHAPGEALVFIHGWLLSHHYWEPVIQALDAHYPCLSYDLRGFGESTQGLTAWTQPAPDHEVYAPYSLAAYAQDLGHLLQALNLSKVWLVGHSLGGSVALWAAHLFPEQVRGVICVNAGGGVYLREEFERFRNAGQQIVRWRSLWLQYLPGLDWVFSRLMVCQPLTLQWGRQRLLDLLTAHPDAAVGSLLESTTQAEVHRLPQIVANLSQPVHFIAGAQDTVMEEKYVRHLASFHPLFRRPEGNISVLSACGHMAMIECPQQLAQCIYGIVQHHNAVPSPENPGGAVDEAFFSQSY
jgi:2-succinyl-6-hydroxy-2,4-cyclohexadiene-1-carboxylate synthase